MLFHGETPKLITGISRNINRYYCTSYMFILPLQTIFVAKFGKLPEMQIMPFFVSIAIVFMCYWIIKIYDATIARPIQKMNPVLKLGTYVLILAASAIVLIRVYPQLDVYPNIWNNYLLDALKGPGGMM